MKYNIIFIVIDELDNVIDDVMDKGFSIASGDVIWF